MVVILSNYNFFLGPNSVASSSTLLNLHKLGTLAVSGSTKVSSSKFISNVDAGSLCKFVFVRQFISAPIFAQNSRSPYYHVAKRCDFNLVNKVNINSRCSVSVCRKVRKSVLASRSTNVFHTPAPDVVNVTIAPPPYQNLAQQKM